MRPLIRMAWATSRRLLLLMSPLLAFYLALMVVHQVTKRGTDIPAIAFTCMFMLIIVSTFQGLTFDVEGFMASLPVTRAQLVRTKYLLSFLGLLAGLALTLAVAGLAHALAPGRAAAPTPEELRSAVALALVDAFGLFAFLPFVHAFEPSRGILAFSLAAILALAASLAGWGLDGAADLFRFFQRVLAQPAPALGLIGGLLAFGLLSLSLSTWAYARRSF